MKMPSAESIEWVAGHDRAPSLRPTWGNHVVQFYETEDFLAEVVAEFIGPGLSAGDPAVIIATRSHQEAIWCQLEERKVDLDRAIDERRLQLLDADEMVRLLVVNGVASSEAFSTHVGTAIREARGRVHGRPVRAFGEVVDILCKRGNPYAAAKLEEMWNELAKTETFTLLCAYELSQFRGVGRASTFETVCAGHTHVLLTESFCGLDEPSRLREIGRLELRTRTLEAEMERRQALESALDEREDALRDFIDNGLDGVQWIDLDGEVVFCNVAQLDLLGYSELELLGRHVCEVVVDGEAVHDRIRSLGEGETIRDLEVQMRCRDGTLKDVLINASAYWQNGRVVHTRWFSRDITDRKRAENELREQNRINAELLGIARRAEQVAMYERERLRQLLVQSPALIVIFHGPDFVFDFVNDAFSRLLGGASVLGKTLAEVFPDYPPERKAILERVRATGERHIENGVRSTFDWNRSGSPQERVFNVVFEPYRDENGNVEGLMSFGFDTTEQVASQRKSEAAAVELELVNRTKDEFLATLSHELRTPLNAILGYTRMLRSGVLPPEKMAQALETIERNAMVQSQLVEDLLDVSRIVAGKLRMQVIDVDLGLVVESAVEAVRPAAAGKGVRLDVCLRGGESLAGDPERLQQVVWNLLTNAVRFTPSGGTVCLSVRAVDSATELVVTDTGQGIPSEFLPLVFERFRQADATTSRSHGGLGLGLSIVRSIVELHGGSVFAESPGIGKGARFTVRLPRSLAPSSVRTGPPISRVVASADVRKHDLDGVHVLVVDDERDARELVAEMLIYSSRARVTTSGNVADALRAINDSRPDIVVSDIGMPGEDGYALIKKLRAMPAAEGGRIPAVALTAYVRVEDRKKALVAGFNMHVPKPVERTELLAVLANLTTMFPAAKRA